MCERVFVSYLFKLMVSCVTTILSHPILEIHMVISEIIPPYWPVYGR